VAAAVQKIGGGALRPCRPRGDAGDGATVQKKAMTCSSYPLSFTMPSKASMLLLIARAARSVAAASGRFARVAEQAGPASEGGGISCSRSCWRRRSAHAPVDRRFASRRHGYNSPGH
jgi:hypothetical protein